MDSTPIVIDGYHHARNRNRCEPYHNAAHAVVSALALVAFVVGGLVWLAA